MHLNAMTCYDQCRCSSYTKVAQVVRAYLFKASFIYRVQPKVCFRFLKQSSNAFGPKQQKKKKVRVAHSAATDQLDSALSLPPLPIRPIHSPSNTRCVDRFVDFAAQSYFYMARLGSQAKRPLWRAMTSGIPVPHQWQHLWLGWLCCCSLAGLLLRPQRSY